MIYFVQGEKTKLIKIGITNDGRHFCPHVRLSGLQSGSPDKLKLLGVIYIEPKKSWTSKLCRQKDVELEQAIHSKFIIQHVHGEWFMPSKILSSFITEKARPPVCDCNFSMLPPARSAHILALLRKEKTKTIDTIRNFLIKRNSYKKRAGKIREGHLPILSEAQVLAIRNKTA